MTIIFAYFHHLTDPEGQCWLLMVKHASADLFSPKRSEWNMFSVKGKEKNTSCQLLAKYGKRFHKHLSPVWYLLESTQGHSSAGNLQSTSKQPFNASLKGREREERGGGREGVSVLFVLRACAKLSDTRSSSLSLFSSRVEWYRGYHYHHPSKQVRQSTQGILVQLILMDSSVLISE